MLGIVSLVPNPCTTEPCLPGMAYAVTVDGTPIFLTRDDRLIMSSGARGRDIPAPGTSVIMTGVPQEHRDVRGRPYRTIGIEALRL